MISTASNLVFQVTPQGRLIAYTADTGVKLLDIPTGQTAGMGPPITYLLDGKQYIALMGGLGNPSPPGSVAPPFPPPATPPATPPLQPKPRLFVFTVDPTP